MVPNPRIDPLYLMLPSRMVAFQNGDLIPPGAIYRSTGTYRAMDGGERVVHHYQIPEPNPYAHRSPTPIIDLVNPS